MLVKRHCFLILIILMGLTSPLSLLATEIHQDLLLPADISTDGVIRNLYSVKELKKNDFSFGTYHVDGYVVKIYTCPPCLKNDLCKPCMPDHIVISDKKDRLKDYSLTDAHMILFVDDVRDFKLGRKYRFLITISDVRSVDKHFNNTKIVHFEKL